MVCEMLDVRIEIGDVIEKLLLNSNLRSYLLFHFPTYSLSHFSILNSPILVHKYPTRIYDKQAFLKQSLQKAW